MSSGKSNDHITIVVTCIVLSVRSQIMLNISDPNTPTLPVKGHSFE